MRTLGAIILVALLLSGCASRAREPAQPPASKAPEPQAPLELPERITIPSSYRLMLLDGHLALVREADPEAIDRGPASLRVVTGEIERGELAYQPGLLPQELAAEVAANRESSQRMENALSTVLARSRELSDQASALQAEARHLSQDLAAAHARVAELEAASRAARPAPASPAPAAPPE